jgi:hypothetical protein
MSQPCDRVWTGQCEQVFGLQQGCQREGRHKGDVRENVAISRYLKPIAKLRQLLL